jgi:hypothetical protein
MTKVYPGFSHVEGSLVVPGLAIVKNNGKLYLVEPASPAAKK